MLEIEVDTLAACLSDGTFDLLDVREDWEFELCRLPGSRHIPLGEVPQRLGELDPARALVVICHHGVRSRVAQHFLLERGFTQVLNLNGGIDAWAMRIDSRMATY